MHETNHKFSTKSWDPAYEQKNAIVSVSGAVSCLLMLLMCCYCFAALVISMIHPSCVQILTLLSQLSPYYCVKAPTIREQRATSLEATHAILMYDTTNGRS